MSQLKGPISIIMKDLKVQLYIFTGITLLLIIIFNSVGYFVKPDKFDPFISGPIYGIMMFLPLFMFGDALKSTIGFGGTRTNYLTALFISYFSFIVSLMAVHNVLFQLSRLFTEYTRSTTEFMHLASLFGVKSGFAYFWVDILLAVFIIGTGSIISAIFYRFGYVWTLGITLSLGVAIFLWVTLGDISGILTWLLDHLYLSLHFFSLLGVGCMACTYPLIKKVQLKI